MDTSELSAADIFVHKQIMNSIANLMRSHQGPPIANGHSGLGMFGELELNSGLYWDNDRDVTYSYMPHRNSYGTTYTALPDDRFDSSLYPPPFKPSKTHPLPKPQYTPAEPDPTQQIEKQDKKVKAKSVKKRIKKRRQKERKRLEKLKREQQKPKKNTEENGETKKADKATTGGQSSSCDSDSSDDSEESEEEAESDSETEELDLTSSFVNKAALIVKRKLEQKEPKYKPERKEEKKAPVKPVAEPTKDKPVRPVPEAPKPALSKDISAAPINKPTYEDNVKISTELATLGNQHASAGRYDMAVQYFTAAIKYNPKEFKLFGNRSFCFEKLQDYEKALTDAQLSINMAPGWHKGLYRMGRALVGLKRYEEAASTYKQVLKLDSSCTEAAQELMRVQVTQLMDCGFTREQSSNALLIHGTMSGAMEALSKLNPSHTGTIYKVPVLPPAVSETQPRATAAQPKAAAFSSGPPKTLPSAFSAAEHQKSPSRKPHTQNTSHVVPQAAPSPSAMKTGPEEPKPTHLELFPIWVGNVLPTTTMSMLSDLFSSVGRIHSIKLLSGKRCAFVNFTTQEHCDQAIRQYHGYEMMGCKLALRYPDRIPQGMGISRAAMKSEPLQEDLYWQKKREESGPRRK